MKVYYSIEKAIECVRQKQDSSLHPSTGWYDTVTTTKQYLHDAGIEFVSEPDNADVELFVGHPTLRLKSEVRPSVILTMMESSRANNIWVNSLNTGFDLVVTPSQWGVDSFVKSGVTTPVEKLNLCVDSSRYPFVERDVEVNGMWVYLTSCVFPSDRKNASLVMNAFQYGHMPDDCFLIMKSRPRGNEQPVVGNISDNIAIVHEDMPFDRMIKELYHQAHVSVNPSSAEGWGLLPHTQMLTGCCGIMTNYSAFTEFNKYSLKLNYNEVPTYLAAYAGCLAEPNFEHMVELMLWTHQNREESLELGRKSSQWLAKEFSVDKFIHRLIDKLQKVIKHVPKRVEKYNPDKMHEWYYTKGKTWIEI